MSDPEEQNASKDGYQLDFYPGFLSLCTVRSSGGGEVEVYRQQGTYHLPPGQTRPRSRHRLRFQGGAKGQDVTLEVTDPALRIKKITIELYGDDHVAGSGRESATEDTVTLTNNGTTCPPECPA